MIAYCMPQRHLADSHSKEGSSGCQNVNNKRNKKAISSTNLNDLSIYCEVQPVQVLAASADESPAESHLRVEVTAACTACSEAIWRSASACLAISFASYAHSVHTYTSYTARQSHH